MITINFNAFSFLKLKCNEMGIKCPNPALKIDKEMSALELAKELGFDEKDIEAVFINHKLTSADTIIKDKDKVALVPPGGIPNHVAAYVGKTKGA